MAFGPSLGANIAMGYLPADKAVEGDTVLIEYFGEQYEAKTLQTSGQKASKSAIKKRGLAPLFHF